MASFPKILPGRLASSGDSEANKSVRSVARRIAFYLTLAVALIYFVAYMRLFSAYPFDDAYIHMRLARNFVELGEPYFNRGEPVMATSSLLWTLLVSGLFKLFGPVPGVLTPVSFLLVAFAFAACAYVLKERYGSLSAMFVAFLILILFLLPTSAGLMETPLAILLFLISVIAFKKEKYFALGFFCALAFATRYEFAIWGIIAFLFTAGLRAKRKFVVGAVVPLVALVVFDLQYFDTIIPNTVIAKTKVYSLSFSEVVIRMKITLGTFAILMLCNAFVLYEIFRTRRPAWLKAVALFPLVLLLAYFLRRTFIFPWYSPLFFVPFALAHGLCLSRRTMYATALFLACTAGSVKSAIIEGVGLVEQKPSAYREYQSALRVRQYLRIGSELPPRETLMTSEIGGLGWVFRGRIIDADGLVSPECLKYHPMKVPGERQSGAYGSIPRDAVADLKPALVVSMDVLSESVRREIEGGKLPGYRLVRRYPIFDPRDIENASDAFLENSKFIDVYAIHCEGQ